MPTLTTLRKAVLISLYGSAALGVFGMCAAPAMAQTGDTASAADTGAVQTVSVVGSRRVTASSATDTMVPVDIIPMTKVAEQGGQFDLAQSLQYISPSFNSTRQTGADGADLVDSAALRGLGSDQTLVLVNGKRRHTTALVNLFGDLGHGNDIDRHHGVGGGTGGDAARADHADRLHGVGRAGGVAGLRHGGRGEDAENAEGGAAIQADQNGFTQGGQGRHAGISK